MNENSRNDQKVERESQTSQSSPPGIWIESCPPQTYLNWVYACIGWNPTSSSEGTSSEFDMYVAV